MGSDQNTEPDRTFDIESIVPEIVTRPTTIKGLDEPEEPVEPIIAEAVEPERVPDSAFVDPPDPEDLVGLIHRVSVAVRTGNPENLTADEIKSVVNLPGFSSMIGGQSKSIDQIRDDYLREAERNLQLRKELLNDPDTSAKTKLAILKDMDDRAGLTPTRRVEQISFRMNKDQAEFVGKVMKETGR